MTPIQALFLLLVALNAADIYTAHAGMRLGAVEANRFLRPLIDRLGAVPVLLALKLPVLIGIWLYLQHPVMLYVVPGLCAVYAYVVTNNINVLRKMGRGGTDAHDASHSG